MNQINEIVLSINPAGSLSGLDFAICEGYWSGPSRSKSGLLYPADKVYWLEYILSAG